jgi:hypothetical protein
MGTGGPFSPGGGREVGLTTRLLLVPGSGMRGAIPPPQYVFMAWYLVKDRDNFTYTATFGLQYSIWTLSYVLRTDNFN